MTFQYELPEEVTVTSDGPVRIITLNRPDKFNAVNPGIHRGLATVWRQLANDREAGAAVLTGAGSAFCAGGDMDWFGEIAVDMDERDLVMAEAKEVVTEMIRCPVPVVAAVNGPAVGLGCSIAVLCDIVLIAEKAFFADPHVSIGLVAGDGGAVSWPMLIGMLRAKEYLLTGDKIPAVEAERLGLANRVVAGDALMTEALALAHRLAEQPRKALRATKLAMNAYFERAFAGVLDYALAAEAECFTSQEHADRVARFKQGRK